MNNIDYNNDDVGYFRKSFGPEIIQEKINVAKEKKNIKILDRFLFDEEKSSDSLICNLKKHYVKYGNIESNYPHRPIPDNNIFTSAENLITGYNIINKELTKLNLESYRRINMELLKKVNKSYDKLWFHKYFSLIFFEKFGYFHKTELMLEMLKKLQSKIERDMNNNRTFCDISDKSYKENPKLIKSFIDNNFKTKEKNEKYFYSGLFAIIAKKIDVKVGLLCTYLWENKR